MRGLIIRFVVTGIAVLLASHMVPGIVVESPGAGLAAIVLLALLNALLRPILYLLSIPLIILTLGLFTVIINAILLQLTAYFVGGFVVEGFWPAFWGALIISVVSSVLNLMISEEGKVQVVVHRSRPENRPPRIIN
jgi:putative membrane protein